MGYLAPLIFAVVLLGLGALFNQESKVTAINTTAAQAQNDGQSFLAYRNAVMTYQQNNPTFTGVVPGTTVNSLAGPFSATFLAKVSNIVVATGLRNGRVVICSGTFAHSVAGQAAVAANNDASFGISNGPTWTSAGVGASTLAMPLASAIAAGNIVSVIEMDL